MRRIAPPVAALVAVAAESWAIVLAPPGPARWNEVAVACVVWAYAAVGVLILRHRPGHPVGLVASVIAPVWAIGQLLVAWSASVLDGDPAAVGASLASVVGSTLRGLPWLVVVLWLPNRFPDGEPPTTRLRRAAERIAVTTVAMAALVSLFSTTLTDVRFAQVRNPIGVPWTSVSSLAQVGQLVLIVAGIVLATAGLVQRYRHGGPLDRQQTGVFGLAFLAPLAAVAATWLLDATPPWVFAASSILLPVAIGVSVLQRRLYDIPLVVNRSLTYGALWLAVAALYGLVVGGVGTLLRRPDAIWLPWMGAAVVAVSFAPLRAAVERAANRLVYGQWARPADVLARASRRLRDVGAVPALLQSLVDDLADGLGLGYVALADPRGRVLASRGEPSSDTDELPVSAYGEPVGTLVWGRQSIRDVDRDLLVELTTQLGAVVHAEGLLQTIRASQERLVLAGEEERRRLRRDLHDGLGPALAGLSLQVDTLRNEVRSGPVDPDATEASLLALRSGIQATVQDIRRIVESLRPPALDELGLTAALAELAARVAREARMEVTVDAGPLPRLSAAAEVAAYRITQEAVTNAVKHSGAQRISIGLSAGDGSLVLRVADDGVGTLVPREDGVGLSSMRERASELGGELYIDASTRAGVVVTARLPMGSNR